MPTLWPQELQHNIFFLSFNVSQSLFKHIPIESVIPSNHLILSPSSPPALNLFQHKGLYWQQNLEFYLFPSSFTDIKLTNHTVLTLRCIAQWLISWNDYHNNFSGPPTCLTDTKKKSFSLKTLLTTFIYNIQHC